MDKSYDVGGWRFEKNRKPFPRYSKLKLLPFSFCNQIFKNTYGRVKHNLACAILEDGKLKQVVMSTIFHFSIFNSDRVS